MSKDANEYPKALYRPAEVDSGHAVHEVWGHKVHMLTVDDTDAEKEAVAAGWDLSPPEEKGPKDFKAAAPKPAPKPAA